MKGIKGVLLSEPAWGISASLRCRISFLLRIDLDLVGTKELMAPPVLSLMSTVPNQPGLKQSRMPH